MRYSRDKSGSQMKIPSSNLSSTSGNAFIYWVESNEKSKHNLMFSMKYYLYFDPLHGKMSKIEE